MALSKLFLAKDDCRSTRSRIVLTASACLPTAALLARAGHAVVGVDRDAAIRTRIATGSAGDTETVLAAGSAKKNA